ncbi:Calcium-binding EF-hand [Cynara cardunculus var. scolymus]|uniref:Calcium-binding EF-hand n=1 Tax=Cynara cardunculus var. scolymus TaxID=59895 RepID=A0A103Y7U4_CYNCS|nr:Calcium-binding EF-hand [Cynara cardunculus var. scolymus]
MEEGPKSVIKSGEVEVMDGSDIMELVENDKVFSNFVDHKFRDLDRDCDGHLSVKELQPAVADIGAALGLPAQGTSADSDHIYAEVLSEFTHGKDGKVSKTEFKKVLSDFLIGMAAGLKRDPIVILRIDGEDLLEFIDGPSFEPEMMSIFSEIDLPNGSLTDYINKAFEKLTVDKGMPPSCGVGQDQPVSQDTFLVEFRKVAETVAQRLKEQPVIVAHSENTFDGTGIRRLLSNKFELEKMDQVIGESCKMFDMDDGKLVKEEEFKKLLVELLGSIMLQLEGNPISVSTNSVVHEPLTSASTLLQPSSM